MLWISRSSTINEDRKLQICDGIFQRWPQIKMVVQMLACLFSSSGQRKVFENQVANVKRPLDNAKETSSKLLHGPVSDANRAASEPKDGKVKDCFGTVFIGSDSVKLGVHCHTADKVDVHLP